MKGSKITRLAIVAAAVAAFVPTTSQAAGSALTCKVPAGGQGTQIDADLCARGPSSCIAVGLYARLEPTLMLPGGATSQISRSQADAYAQSAGGYGLGQAHADTAAAKADVPPYLGDGTVESACDATAWASQGFRYHRASGHAETERLSLDLNSQGIPVQLDVDVLREDGWSIFGTGGNSANVAAVNGSVFGNPVAINATMPPNTVIPLGPATLYLNEQRVGFSNCPVFWGDALRLEITDPFSGTTIATVIVSWVSTSTC